MAELDLDAIEARAQAATPAPWCYYLGDLWRGTADALATFDADPENTRWPFEEDETSGHLFHGDPVREEDAEFIAHARQDIPALVAEVRRLRGALQRARELAEVAERNRVPTSRAPQFSGYVYASDLLAAVDEEITDD